MHNCHITLIMYLESMPKTLVSALCITNNVADYIMISIFTIFIMVPALTRSTSDILPNQQQSISHQQYNPALENLLQPLPLQGYHTTCLSNTK